MSRKEDLPLFNTAIKEQKRFLIEHIKMLPDAVYRVEITKVRDQRSLSQLAYIWGVIYPRIAPMLTETQGVDFDQWRTHLFLKDMFLRRAIVNQYTSEMTGAETPSLSDISKEDCSAYIENIIAFAADNRVIIPPASQYEPKGELV